MKILEQQKGSDKKTEKDMERQEYLSLLSENYSSIPNNFVNLVIKKHPDWRVNRIENVRYGRTHDLKMLREIIKLTCK